MSWGWCVHGRHWAMVVFIGPVESDGMQAPVHACEGCCAYMRNFVRNYNRHRDRQPA